MLITDNAHGASVTKTVGYGAHFQASFFTRVCCKMYGQELTFIKPGVLMEKWSYYC